jgi:hypothetical protein
MTFAEGAAGSQLGRFDAGKGLAVDAEGVEADGEETETLGRRDDDAKRLAVNFYGHGPRASGLVNCVLHENRSCGASLTTAGVLPGF